MAKRESAESFIERGKQLDTAYSDAVRESDDARQHLESAIIRSKQADIAAALAKEAVLSYNAELRARTQPGESTVCPLCHQTIGVTIGGARVPHSDPDGLPCVAPAARQDNSRCPKCGLGSRTGKNAFKAHVNPATGRWCSEGPQPTETQLNRAAKGKSVRAVGGGLPTLGKR